MKYLHLIVFFFLINIGIGFTQPIQLNPDSIDSFVMDPATFDENDNTDSIWELAPFGKKDPTKYRSGEKEDGEPIIKASSEKSISSVQVKVNADPNEFPIIEWEWMIESVLESGDVTTKAGDDYAARIYITFDYPVSELGFGDKIKYRFYKTFTSFDIPTRALNYVWANKAKVGSIQPNPYTDWVQVIAVESGNEKAGYWQIEKRNIVEDYRAAFGEEPPAITGIQIMTDSDNTEESAKAAYSKIILRKKSVPTVLND